MSIPTNERGKRATIRWAIGSAILLVLVGFFTYLIHGQAWLLPMRLMNAIVLVWLLPAAVLYLDGRSRTPTALICMAIGLLVASLLWGWVTASLCLSIAMVVAAAYLLKSRQVPFPIALLISAGTGVVGALVAIAVLGLHIGEPINHWAADVFVTMARNVYHPGLLNPLDIFVMQESIAAIPSGQAPQFGEAAELLNAAIAIDFEAKVAIARPFLTEAFALLLPSIALTTGVLAGGFAYYAPMFLLSTRKAIARGDNEGLVAVPPFAAFDVPVYIVVAMWLLQLVMSFATNAGWGSFAAISQAVGDLLSALMILQAMALFSFLLNRRRVPAPIQALIIIPAALLLSWLMTLIGVIDVLFHIRSVLSRMDRIKVQSKQAMTPEGMEELRRLDEAERRRKQKDKNDREDEEK